MIKNFISLSGKKRLKHITAKKGVCHTTDICIFRNTDDAMIAVVHRDDSDKSKEFQHLTTDQRQELNYVLRNFDKIYSRL